MLVADVMSKNPVTLTPEHSVRHAAQIMLHHRVSGVPVVDDGNVIGVLTEGDLLRRVELGTDANAPSDWLRLFASGAARDFVRTHSWRVGDVMSKPVVTVDRDMPLSDAALLLATRGIKRVPVLYEGELVGILSRADLLKIVASAPPERSVDGDEALLRSARARVSEVTLLGATPTVSVEQGVVHLWGTVQSQAEKDAARVAIETIPGLAGVEEHLTILS